MAPRPAGWYIPPPLFNYRRTNRVPAMTRRLWIGTASVVLATLVLAARPAVAPAASTPDTDSLKTFNQILDLVETRYVDEVPSRDLVFGAIHGMIEKLDPHTYFLDPKSYRAMQEEQQGSF